jgi:cytochrome oxidase Cu insertion factor (SCO1/SenC/PrrC family)
VNFLFAALMTLVPVHGVAIATLPDGTAIARTDAVPHMLPSIVARYRLVPAQRIANGTSFDALLDRSTTPPVLRDAVAARVFSPGLPDSAKAVPVDFGSALPSAQLVDQRGHPVMLDRAFAGKTLLLSFIFTRCPDRTLCPAISGKFAYLQSRLDPRRFALAEITLDPPYDSPAVLQAYGRNYGARAGTWWLLTGTGSTIQRLLDAFRISSMRLSSDNFLHDDKLFIVSPQGRIATIVQTGAWDPSEVIAQARVVSGMTSNPFERLKLALIAEAVAVCGGSQFAGIALLELTLFLFLTLTSFAALWAVARLIWSRG